MVIQSTANSGLFPRRRRDTELKETNKEISYKGIPTNLDEIRDARTVRNEDLPETIQSEAFDVGFAPPDTHVFRRLNVF